MPALSQHELHLAALQSSPVASCLPGACMQDASMMAALPEPSQEMAPLPRVIRGLVQRRRMVKDCIKSERDLVRGMRVWVAGSVSGCMRGWVIAWVGACTDACAIGWFVGRAGAPSC